MTGTHKAKVAICLAVFGLLGPLAGFGLAAQDELMDGQLQLVIQFISDPDRETRAMGLQYVREEVPGEAATGVLAALLPDLPPDGQAELLEALGDRGDVAARPAILGMLESQRGAVRAAALGALGALGDASAVPLLTRKASPSDLEKQAARQSLIRLRGDEVNAAILATMAGGDANARVELLGVLAARNAKETLPTVLESAADPEPSVRVAAIEALRFLADESHTAALVDVLKAAGNDAERGKAELALLTICTRGREVCCDALIAGLADAEPPARIALLHGLARAGGATALEAVAARQEDDDKDVRDEAIRMLSAWPDPAVAPMLVNVAESAWNSRHQVLAVRGLVRLASPQGETPADLDLLAQAMSLAKRPQEKRLALGVLSGVATPAALALVVTQLDDLSLVEEAALAAVMIAEKIEGGAEEEIRSAMEKVVQQSKSEEVRQRAQAVLESLGGAAPSSET